MRFLTIGIFFFSVEVLSFNQNPQLRNLAENTWMKIGPEETGTMSPFGGILSYSGAAYDPTRHKYIVFGGGHNDYYGNDLWFFDIATATWEQQYRPGTLSPAPVSRHTYDQGVYLSYVDRFFEATGFEAAGNPRYLPDAWSYDIQNKRWTRHQDMPINAAGGDCCGEAAYDPVTQKVFYEMVGDIYEFTYETNAWVRKLTIPGTVGGIEKSMAFDTANRVLVIYGGRYPVSRATHVYLIDSNRIKNMNPTNYPTTGLSWGMGFEYNPHSGLSTLWTPDSNARGPSTVWFYDYRANNWTSIITKGMEPVTDGYGVFGNFVYDPVDSVFLACISLTYMTGIQMYAYRPPRLSTIRELARLQAKGKPILSVSPNPFHSKTKIRLFLSNKTLAPIIRLRFYDVHGKEVDRMEGLVSELTAGVAWRPKTGRTSVYFLKTEVGNQEYAARLLFLASRPNSFWCGAPIQGLCEARKPLLQYFQSAFLEHHKNPDGFPLRRSHQEKCPEGWFVIQRDWANI